MTNLQKLKKAIIKEIPEIVKLEFGCKVFVQNNCVSTIIMEDRRGYTFIPEAGLPPCDFSGKSLGNELEYFNEKHIKEIIGRPITLADVLRVVWIVQPTMKITDKDRIDFGAMVNVTEERAFEVVQEWNLSKNNLDLQSKGTIDFLTDLICKKDE